MLIDDVSAILTPLGFCLRGSFTPQPGDAVPALPDGTPAGTVLMIGNAGPAMWQQFCNARRAGRSPLDTWTREALTPIAEEIGAGIVFPFQRPFLPFQQWATRAEPCHSSPLGILIHPRFGLWHALRGALLLADKVGPAGVPRTASPCDGCADKPCLSACPNHAFSTQGYDTDLCLSRLDQAEGIDCIALGCRARRACPIGRSYQYAPAQARFHMDAFRRTLRGS
ncbi:MAG TPA: ferredoxin [Rhodopseudomonas sp.]|uniref:ferredoxin n=1 Tax=Rhodopseudomonas sp. TaxID=1078 RepID=UPI002ED7DCD0